MLKKSMKAAYSPSRNRAKINLKTTTSANNNSKEPVAANVKVCVRIRPPNEREVADNRRRAVNVIDSRMLIFDPKRHEDPFFYQGVQQNAYNPGKRANRELPFMFDVVFDEAATNEDVFRESTRDVIASLMEGYNCSVFVYGATGAGKTYTMLGRADSPGITYLTMQELFRSIEVHRTDREFEICVSYLEIYNENVHDLLRPSGPLHLREDSKFGVQIAGLYTKTINTAQELLDMLDKGNKSRTQHPTDANSESSRSHAVFQVYVKMRAKATNQAKIVKLSMIDLAGSERGSATGCKGDRFKEGANINRSLLALGNCINQLADGSKFIPYRDSKLTRLLKDSLGGNCRTVMIANIGPTCLSFEDTYNTLKYATRANKIQQRMKKNIVNCDGHVAQYVKQAEELRERVAQLEAELARAKNNPPVVVNTVVPQIKVEDMDKEVSKAKSRLETRAERHFALMKDLLNKKRKQRGLAARATRKYRAALALSTLCGDVSDAQLRDVCCKDINRLQMSSDCLIRQAETLQEDITDLTQKYSTSVTEFDDLQKETASGNENVNTVITGLNYRNNYILAQAKVDHLQALSNLQQDEILKLNNFMKNSLEILKKNYVRIKQQGMFTSKMEEEYNMLIREAKNSRAVTWEDDQVFVECDDAHFKYLIDLEPLMSNEFPKISNEHIVFSPVIVSNPNDETANEKPKKIPEFKTDETIILTDSIDGTDLNATYIESADVTDVEENKKISYKPQKPIDPSLLNSTFVLAEKTKTETTVKKSNLKSVDAKRVLAEKTNVPLNNKVMVLKNKPTNKVIPFTGIMTNSKENKTGFGSTVHRFKYNIANNTTTPNVQIGLKTVRTKERGALASVSLPYVRPTPSKGFKR